MRPRTFLCVSVLLFGALAATAQEPPPTIASVVDKQISGIEKQFTQAADAMPEAKYGFSPEGLNIAGSDYKGVRTFGQQVSHIAASNYAIRWRLTGESVPKTPRAGTARTP
jgi:hypothetical protein